MPVTHVGLVSVPVSDQARAKAFYVDALGLEVRSDNPFTPTARWIELAPPGAQTALTLANWFPAMPPGSQQGLLFLTDDVAAMHAALQAKGIQTSAIEQAPWGAYFTLNDPDGNGLVIQQPPAPQSG